MELHFVRGNQVAGPGSHMHHVLLSHIKSYAYAAILHAVTTNLILTVVIDQSKSIKYKSHTKLSPSKISSCSSQHQHRKLKDILWTNYPFYRLSLGIDCVGIWRIYMWIFELNYGEIRWSNQLDDGWSVFSFHLWWTWYIHMFNSDFEWMRYSSLKFA